MADPLSVKELLDRLDALAERGSRERAAQAERFSADLRSLRVENRWLVLVLIAVVAALAGVQVSLSPDGIETKPAAVEVSSVSDAPLAEPLAAPVPVEGADHEADMPPGGAP